LRHPPSLPVTLLVPLVALLAGCSSGSGETESRRPEPERSAERPTTTAAPGRIDLSKPIPGGSLHGTPRPPLENTGDDYVAIFESLDGNLRWLYENPDAALVSDLYVPGTAEHEAGVQNFQYLTDRGWRAADEGYRLVSVEVRDARPQVATLHVVDEFASERVVDATGNQVGEAKQHSAPQAWIVTLVPDSAGHWRIADWAPAEDEEVEL
jgi:hypothetical protein